MSVKQKKQSVARLSSCGVGLTMSWVRVCSPTEMISASTNSFAPKLKTYASARSDKKVVFCHMAKGTKIMLASVTSLNSSVAMNTVIASTAKAIRTQIDPTI